MTLNIGRRLLEQVGAIAEQAGGRIISIRDKGVRVEAKADSSPVTEADREAEEFIIHAIRKNITDALPIVSEEAFSRGEIPDIGETPFWLVDALDGTKEFVKGGTDFTVNIAIIENAKPVMGVVHAPVTKATYRGSREGSFFAAPGVVIHKIACRPAPADGLTALVSRSHRTPEIDGYLAGFAIKQEISAGSSLKFCEVARGNADIYPRLGRTMEWDTAAGHAVLRFAGGQVKTLDGVDLCYAKPGFENPHFVAAGPDIGISRN
ncbi:MAG: 3'(2'),5'-bisphosphate nucleotidase [Rhodospirillales bacterium RIFCSPLOWO2_12_FULL_58_28]|nr:MAG: 3'(2'),5'-bisphosphate nucleotidase [Rhodospirillales bacterium RIFCSPLOWO2_12_FULL_58_28]